jgi:hypothetical protein
MKAGWCGRSLVFLQFVAVALTLLFGRLLPQQSQAFQKFGNFGGLSRLAQAENQVIDGGLIVRIELQSLSVLLDSLPVISGLETTLGQAYDSGGKARVASPLWLFRLPPENSVVLWWWIAQAG